MGGTGTESARGVNLVVVRGQLSSDPVERALPSGDVVWNYEVTVRTTAGTAESVPVVLTGKPGPKGLSAGEEVVVVGRVRRRFFRSGGRTSSRTEVMAERLVRANRPASVAAAVALAGRSLADVD